MSELRLEFPQLDKLVEMVDALQKRVDEVNGYDRTVLCNLLPHPHRTQLPHKPVQCRRPLRRHPRSPHLPQEL